MKQQRPRVCTVASIHLMGKLVNPTPGRYIAVITGVYSIQIYWESAPKYCGTTCCCNHIFESHLGGGTRKVLVVETTNVCSGLHTTP
jgi:hypothetical protein